MHTHVTYASPHLVPATVKVQVFTIPDDTPACVRILPRSGAASHALSHLVPRSVEHSISKTGKCKVSTLSAAM